MKRFFKYNFGLLVNCIEGTALQYKALYKNL
jgi:hypothetical protein